jgi:hypothetical protein
MFAQLTGDPCFIKKNGASVFGFIEAAVEVFHKKKLLSEPRLTGQQGWVKRVARDRRRFDSPSHQGSVVC